ncbi:hypothetical protein ACWGDE_10365 [Streptomyces sp. NPDC054956]
MKRSARAAATALLLFVAALGLSAPTAGPALAANCPTCVDNASVTAELGPAWGGQSTLGADCHGCWPNEAPSGRTVQATGCTGCWPSNAEPGRAVQAGGCGNCWSEPAAAGPVASRQGRIVQAGGCSTCWPSGIAAPSRWNGDYGNA